MILKKNLITNCPKTVDDAKQALNIYDTDLVKEELHVAN
jgi:hypothetical protein